MRSDYPCSQIGESRALEQRVTTERVREDALDAPALRFSKGTAGGFLCVQRRFTDDCLAIGPRYFVGVRLLIGRNPDVDDRRLCCHRDSLSTSASM